MYILTATVFILSLTGHISVKSQTVLLVKDELTCEAMSTYFHGKHPIISPGTTEKTTTTCKELK